MTIRKGRLRHGFRHFLSLHRRRWVLVSAVLFLAAAVLIVLFFPTQYRSHATIAPVNRLDEDSHFDNPVDLLVESHNLAVIFVSLYDSHEVLDHVRAQMGWQQMSNEQLLEKVQVSRTVKTVVINVTATDTDAATAQKLAGVYADAMAAVIAPTLGFNNVEMLREPTAPQSVRIWPFAAVTALLLSLLLALLAEAVLFVCSTRINLPQDLDRYHLPVFGQVPAFACLQSATREDRP